MHNSSQPVQGCVYRPLHSVLNQYSESVHVASRDLQATARSLTGCKTRVVSIIYAKHKELRTSLDAEGRVMRERERRIGGTWHCNL